MATTLTSSYQYIGRSSAVSCASGYNYYILLYAKTSGDITTGKHTVSIKMRLACTSNASFYGLSTTGSAAADGVTAISWNGQDIPASDWSGSSSLTVDGVTYKRYVDLKTGSAVVDTGYGADTTIKITASWVVNESYSAGWSPNTGVKASASISVVLPGIAGASAITSASAVTLGNACAVKWTPLAKTLYFKLVFTLGDTTKTVKGIAPETTSAYTYTGYTLPLALASEITAAKTGTMTVTLTTHTASSCTSSNQVGDASSKTFTVTVPSNSSTQPMVSMSLAPVSSLGSAFSGLYIQGKSKVKATLSATGKYDATISSYSMKVGGTTYDSGDSYTSGYLSTSGTNAVYGYAKDSRGITGSASKDITVIAYSKPQIKAVSGESAVVAARCDSGGNLSDSGTYLKIKAKRSYSKVVSGSKQYNYCKIQYRYKLESASSYSSWVQILATTANSDEIVTGALLSGGLAVESTYMVQVRAIDDIGEYALVTIMVPSDKVYMHRDGARNSLAIGKYIEDDNTVDIAEDITVKIRGKLTVPDEGWVSLGLSSEVAESTNDYGHGPETTGCWYRVVNGNHVHVAFNCTGTWSGSALTVNSTKIPSAYRPERTVYNLVNMSGNWIARVYVSYTGYIRIGAIYSMGGTDASSHTIGFIDGHLDYFI